MSTLISKTSDQKCYWNRKYLNFPCPFFQDEDPGPQLDPSNIMSILVSASFLKMSSLVETALKYAHQNMNKILVVTHNLSCLGEPLLTRYVKKKSACEAGCSCLKKGGDACNFKLLFCMQALLAVQAVRG